MEWTEESVKVFFRDHKQNILIEDGRELLGALYRTESLNTAQLIVFSKILDLGTKIKLSTGWWQIVDHEGFGLFEDNEVKTYRVYILLPIPIFQIDDRIKVKYDTIKGRVLGVNQEENYYLVKVRGVEEKWNMIFQDKYTLLSREKID